jgi:hypothetical protein
VPGEGRGAVGAGPALLALRPLAPLSVGELAAASAPELPALWEPPVLVPQPAERQLQRLRDANATPLTHAAGRRKNRQKATGNEPISQETAREWPERGHFRTLPDNAAPSS